MEAGQSEMLRTHEGEGRGKKLSECPSSPWNQRAGCVRGLGNTIFRGLQNELDLNKKGEDSEHSNHHAATQEAF